MYKVKKSDFFSPQRSLGGQRGARLTFHWMPFGLVLNFPHILILPSQEIKNGFPSYPSAQRVSWTVQMLPFVCFSVHTKTKTKEHTVSHFAFFFFYLTIYPEYLSVSVNIKLPLFIKNGYMGFYHVEITQVI